MHYLTPHLDSRPTKTLERAKSGETGFPKWMQSGLSTSVWRASSFTFFALVCNRDLNDALGVGIGIVESDFKQMQTGYNFKKCK